MAEANILNKEAFGTESASDDDDVNDFFDDDAPHTHRMARALSPQHVDGSSSSSSSRDSRREYANRRPRKRTVGALILCVAMTGRRAAAALGEGPRVPRFTTADRRALRPRGAHDARGRGHASYTQGAIAGFFAHPRRAHAHPTTRRGQRQRAEAATLFGDGRTSDGGFPFPLSGSSRNNDAESSLLRGLFVEPLLASMRWYDAQLRHAPVVTKCASNAVVSSLGDVLAQSLTSSAFDPTRVLTWAIAGSIYFAPIQHHWYNGLARFERYYLRKTTAPRPAQKFKAVMLQILFNQLCGAAVVNAVFLFVLAMLQMTVAALFDGAPFAPVATCAATAATFWTKFPRMMLVNWVFWPIPTVVNLYVVPLQYRVLFSNLCSIFWKCMLSIITAATVASGLPPGGGTAAAPA